VTVDERHELSAEARNLGFLVNDLVRRVPGINEAVVLSADGLLMAMSDKLDREGADRLAAVSSGLIGLAHGASSRFGGGRVNEVIVEMERALLLVTGISDGSALAVVADAACDIGLVGYEMAVFVEQVGTVLTPELRAELQGELLQ
jgi:predicted regulator of Ras-like GTPase activity (Roadblock/LC7/MglB family)